MRPVVNFEHFGKISFAEAWEIQEKMLAGKTSTKLQRRKDEAAGKPFEDNPIQNDLIFCEHPHVYTLGKSGDEKNLLLSPEELKEKGIEYFRINRGGDITYHGPGQLVGYPIFDLDQFKPDLHWYLRGLEEAIIQTIAEFGLKGTRIDGLTGVWLDDEKGPRKIMAIGVRASRWVTMHGFAFNVNTDLSYFDNIIPCGIDDKDVTSLAKELGHEVDFGEVSGIVFQKLKEVFGYEIAPTPATP